MARVRSRGRRRGALSAALIAAGVGLALAGPGEARSRPPAAAAGPQARAGPIAFPIPLPRPRPRPQTAATPAAAEIDTGAASTCRARLGPDLAVLQALPPITGPGDCGATDVVRLDAVLSREGHRVALVPPAVLRCEMAEAVVHWVREEAERTVHIAGAALRSVVTAASFECRGRNRQSGGKLSEHGRANALDVRALVLADGKTLALTDAAVDKPLRERLRQGSCDRFTTVLGPGSDGYHEDHVHLDILQRRSGYRLCQWAVRDPAEAIAAAQARTKATPVPPADGHELRSGATPSSPAVTASHLRLPR